MGFVYVIEAKEAFKVGIAENVRRRLSGLQTASPEKLSLRSHWEAREPHDAEHKLHVALKAFRIRGEWFNREALPLCEEEIRRMCAAGVLFDPQRENRFPLRTPKIWPEPPPPKPRRQPSSITFEGSITEALELLWPTGHFPTWDQDVVDQSEFLDEFFEQYPERVTETHVRRVSPVRSSRGGTYHYPLLYAALCFLRREAEADPAPVREGIVSRGRPPHPEPDSLTAVQHLVHTPEVCKRPAVCPGRYLPPRRGKP